MHHSSSPGGRTHAGRIEFHRTVLRHGKDDAPHGTVVPSRRHHAPDRCAVGLQVPTSASQRTIPAMPFNARCGRLGKELAQSGLRKDERCVAAGDREMRCAVHPEKRAAGAVSIRSFMIDTASGTQKRPSRLG